MSQNGKKIRIYSALEVANLCGVVNQTAINWIKSGYLKAFTTPGGQYRVYADDLNEFLTGRKMRIPEELKIVHREQKKNRNPDEKQKIMIIDDDRDINDVLKRFFSETLPEFEIIQAFDGFEAGFSLSQHQPDIILLDVFLPGIDGITLCKKIKTELNMENSIVIAISGVNDEESEERIMESGADFFYKKPLDLGQLVEDIRVLMNKKF